MTDSDLKQVANVHRLAYDSTHFTSRFSDKMLTDFYRNLLILNGEFCFVASNNNEIAGFIVAGYRTNEAVKIFTKKYFFIILKTLLLNPVFLLDKIKGAYRMLRKKNKNKSIAKLRLLSIAICPSVQGKGAANQLLFLFERYLNEKGITEYGLSVHKENIRAIRFYEKNNFEIEYQTHDAFYFIKKLLFANS